MIMYEYIKISNIKKVKILTWKQLKTFLIYTILH